jgi:hypothetical protein
MSAGEITRAVLEQSCLWSRPAFYGDHQTLTFTTAAAPLVFSGSIKTRPTSYFLCTAINVGLIDQTNVRVGTTSLWTPYNNPYLLTLTNQASGKPYNFGASTPANGPSGVPVACVSSYPVSAVALPTYIYFKPDESVEYSLPVTQQPIAGGGNYPANNDVLTVDVLLIGIEYMMAGATNGQAA